MTLTTYAQVQNLKSKASTFLQAQPINDVNADRPFGRSICHTEHLLMAFFANRPQKLILPESLRFWLFPANYPGAFGQN
ncbi:hypothetical protein QUB68_02290 [Microcoleus sp. A006_D1]|uniref:hypothetical protein n=1 Tax=Microcoleus sp. A006_D1 TaxID=3055267 RepID=UPI002FD1F267